MMHASTIEPEPAPAAWGGLRTRNELLCELGMRLEPLARRIVRDDSEARDVVQDACLQALRAAGRFEGRAQLSTWLHRIVVNAALTRLRRRRRRPEEPLGDAPEEHMPADWASSPEELLARRQARSVVRIALGHLPRNHRLVLELRDIEELDTETTAERLGISPNAVKTRLHRARRALRALLERQALA